MHEDDDSIKAGLDPTESERNFDPCNPASTSKFLALKRKLFPTRKRRHPVRIPPLVVVSPIASSGGNLTPLKSNDHSEDRQEVLSPPSNNQEQTHYPLANTMTVDTDRQRLIRMAVELAQQIGSNNAASCTSDDQDDMDDDLELEHAIAAMDTETSTSEETLAEVQCS